MVASFIPVSACRAMRIPKVLVPRNSSRHPWPNQRPLSLQEAHFVANSGFPVTKTPHHVRWRRGTWLKSASPRQCHGSGAVGWREAKGVVAGGQYAMFFPDCSDGRQVHHLEHRVGWGFPESTPSPHRRLRRPCWDRSSTNSNRSPAERAHTWRKRRWVPPYRV